MHRKKYKMQLLPYIIYKIYPKWSADLNFKAKHNNNSRREYRYLCTWPQGVKTFTEKEANHTYQKREN